jgi:hypothetical protein
MAIKINVDAVLKNAADKKLQAPVIPKFKLASTQGTVKKTIDQIASNAVNQTVITRTLEESKSSLVKSLWVEFNAVKNQRNECSTQIAIMIDKGATQEELRLQYEKIESFRPQLQDLYDKIEYAQMHGELPKLQELKSAPVTLADLKLKRQSLIDERSKLKGKLAKKKALNQEKYVEWELRLAMANTEFEDIIDQIKVMEA